MREFSEVVGAIYDAALTPDAWPTALDRITEMFDARGTVIYFGSEDDNADFIYSSGVEEAVRIYKEEGWTKHDIHAQRAVAQHLTGGDVFDDFSVATPEEIESLPIYTDFFRRVGFGWLMACVLLPDFDMFASVTVTRAKHVGPFTETEKKLLALIGRHVEQALRISLRIANLEASQEVFLNLLDEIECSIYLLDAKGRLRFENRAGRAQLASYFNVLDDLLIARDTRGRSQFAGLVEEAGDLDRRASSPRSCVLRGDEGDRIVVTVLPLTESGQMRIGGNSAARMLVLTTPLERDAKVDPVVLRDLFDLSLGEARLASLIGSGDTVRDAAGRLGVTEGTARIVLKNIFRKIGVNRQAQLVLRVSGLGGLRAHRADGRN